MRSVSCDCGSVVCDFPMRVVLKQLRDKSRMQRVACFICDKAAQYGLSNEGEVSEQVEDFVANEFVGKTQTSIVQHGRVGQHNRIFQGTSTDQPAGLEFLNLMVKTECSGRRNQLCVILFRQFDLK